jgi:hypothetical protein
MKSFIEMLSAIVEKIEEKWGKLSPYIKGPLMFALGSGIIFSIFQMLVLLVSFSLGRQAKETITSSTSWGALVCIGLGLAFKVIGRFYADKSALRDENGKVKMKLDPATNTEIPERRGAVGLFFQNVVSWTLVTFGLIQLVVMFISFNGFDPKEWGRTIAAYGTFISSILLFFFMIMCSFSFGILSGIWKRIGKVEPALADTAGTDGHADDKKQTENDKKILSKLFVRLNAFIGYLLAAGLVLALVSPSAGYYVPVGIAAMFLYAIYDLRKEKSWRPMEWFAFAALPLAIMFFVFGETLHDEAWCKIKNRDTNAVTQCQAGEASFFQGGVEAIGDLVNPTKIVILTPNGGTMHEQGATLDVKWQNFRFDAMKVVEYRLSLSQDGGKSYNTLKSTPTVFGDDNKIVSPISMPTSGPSSAPNVFTESVTLPTGIRGNISGKLRIEAIGVEGEILARNESESTFTIIGEPIKTAPTPGDSDPTKPKGSKAGKTKTASNSGSGNSGSNIATNQNNGTPAANNNGSSGSTDLSGILSAQNKMCSDNPSVCK